MRVNPMGWWLVAAMTVVTLGIGSPPVAAASPDIAKPPAAGRLALFAAGDPRPALALTYRGCRPEIKRYVRGTVVRFDNRPVPGCRVVLQGAAGRFQLCAGRGSIPRAFQRYPRVIVQPGKSQPCHTATGSLPGGD